MSSRGYKIVLTADRTLMSDYSTLFDGMVSASQTDTVPAFILKTILAPAPAVGPDKKVLKAPLGLRRIEAALSRHGFKRKEIGIFRESELDFAVGEDTAIVAVSSGDPAGLGMNSSTMEALYGGTIHNKHFFRQLLAKISSLKKNGLKFKTVVGGPGAWQLLGDKEFEADHIICGYCEGNVSGLFKDIIHHRAAKELEGRNPEPGEIPHILGPSSMGVVETSRGCGMGCAFCTLKDTPMIHLPESTILADIEANISGGNRNIALISEDFFRYGSASFAVPAPEKLIDLLTEIRSKTRTKLIQTDHVNIATAGAYSDNELKEVASLIGGSHERDYIWLNLGIETPSERLLKENRAGGKMLLPEGKNWEAFSLEQIKRLSGFGFFPLISVIIGLPGETEEDALCLERFIDKLKDAKASVFPLYYTAIENKSKTGINPAKKKIYGRIMKKSYSLNFKWVPKMYWENQNLAGVNKARMLMLQFMGKGQRFIMKY